MRHIIIISIILLSFTSNFKAQTGFDLELLGLEQGVFRARSDSERAGYVLQKIDLYINSNDVSKSAFDEAQRINYTLLAHGQKKRFLWNASLLAHLNKDRDYARFYLNRYTEISGDTGIRCLLLSILINNGEDSALLARDVKKLTAFDSGFDCLLCLSDLTYYHKSKLSRYLFASAVLPGLGSMLLGYPIKGVTSTLVNAASAWAIYELVRSNLYINATLWGLTLITKFYIGNLRLTEKLFFVKEAEQKNILAAGCEDKIDNLLKKYPLAFK